MTVAVRELTTPDVPAAVGVIARGMRDNPLHIAALGDDADLRRERLTRMFTVVLPLVFSKGIVLGAFDRDTLVGIAGMVAPGRCQPSFREKLSFTPRIVPVVGSGGIARIGKWMSEWARRDPREAHWHLGPVAVDAHVQGLGIGTLLMSEYCARVDRAKVAGYLETDTLANVAFYERFGFRTLQSASVLGTPNWFMKRAPL